MIWVILFLQLAIILGLSYLISKIPVLHLHLTVNHDFMAGESLSIPAKIDSVKYNIKYYHCDHHCDHQSDYQRDCKTAHSENESNLSSNISDADLAKY